MLKLRFVRLAVLLSFVSTGVADDQPLSGKARTALAAATGYLVSISTEGGYLWRYSEDMKERRGEDKATATQIWVQPPGTPAVGGAFLNAYKVTRDEQYLSAAHAVAQALVRGQLESGGWNYRVEFDPAERGQWAYRTDTMERSQDQDRRRNTTTFDDNNTQSALRFLLAFLDAATHRPAAELAPIREALDYGLTKMIAAQYPNGAWPQRWDGEPHDPGRHAPRPAQIPDEWPRTWLRTNYGNYYTLNDRAQLDCIDTLRDAFHRLGDTRYLDAAERGGDFLIRAQLPEPQSGWAQQYNFRMEPAWARAFEPPAVCSSESAAAMRTLVDLYVDTGDEKYLKPIPPFIAWLNRSQLDSGRWARFYEMSSNKPIYGDRDGIIHYELSEISEERRRGYGWRGSFGIPGAIKYYEAVMADGREAHATRLDNAPIGRVPAESRITRIIEQQDAQGRWLRGGWIDMRQFILNMNLLSAYLESEREPVDR